MKWLIGLLLYPMLRAAEMLMGSRSKDENYVVE